MKNIIKTYYRDISAVSILIIICLVVFSKLVFAPPNVGLGESVAFYSFPCEIIRDELIKHHNIAKWDNVSSAGISLLGIPLIHHFYFITLIVILLVKNSLIAVRYDAMIHLILSGIVMYYLLKTLKCERIPALIGAACYILGINVGEKVTGIIGELHGMVWVPLGIIFMWKGFLNNNLKYFLWGGLALGVQIFAGTMYCIHFTVIFFIFLSLFYLVNSKKNSENNLHYNLLFVFKCSFLFFGAAILISAIKLFPLLQFASLSQRAVQSLYNAEGGDPSNISGIMTLWNSIFRNFAGPHVSWLFMFLILSSVILKRDKQTIFFLISTFLFLWASFGHRAFIDLYAVFFYVIPGFKTNTWPPKFLFMVYIGLVALAGMGASFIFNTIKKGISKKAAYIVLTIILSCIVIDAGSQRYSELMNYVKGYGNRVILPKGIILGAIMEEPEIEIYNKKEVSLKLKIKNIGDLIWHANNGKDFSSCSFGLYINGNFEKEIKILQDIHPCETVELKDKLIIPHNIGNYQIRIGFISKDAIGKIGEYILPLCEISRHKDYKLKLKRIAHTINEPNGLQRKVIGPMPNDYNYILAALNKLEGRNKFRFYTDISASGISYGYMSALYDYQLVNIVFHNSIPKYYSVYIQPGLLAEIIKQKKICKISGLLNTKYIFARKEYVAQGGDLKPILQGKEFEIYENQLALPRIFSIPYAILLIGQEPGSPFNALEAKMLACEEAFDPKKVVIFNGISPFIDAYSIDGLNRFDAIIFSRFRVKDKNKFRNLIIQYKKQGGEVIFLKYLQEELWKHDVNKPPEAIINKIAKENGIIRFRKLLAKFQNVGDGKGYIEYEATTYLSDKIEINLKTFNDNTFVMLSEMYYPGWKAYLNGEKIPLYMADGLIKGVCVPRPGTYNLVFKFDPVSYKVGKWVSIISAFGIVGYLACIIDKKRSVSVL